MIIDVFIPAIVVLLMLLVGTGLQLAQFKAMLRSPRLVIAGMLAQILLLPAGALLIIFLVRPRPELAAGLLLVAACPGGALSNTYCYLGGLNVALSVMLTAVSTMLSFVVLPLILGITFPAIASGWEMDIPVRELALWLLLFLLLPIGAGMLIRARYVESAVLAVLFTGFAVLVARGVRGLWRAVCGIPVPLDRSDAVPLPEWPWRHGQAMTHADQPRLCLGNHCFISARLR